jgi:hypothetical protein
MAFVSSSVGAVAVASIYLIYGAYCDYLRARWKRECVLRERVAYLLWQAAGRAGRPRLRKQFD